MSYPSSKYFVIKPKLPGLPAGLPAEAAGSTGLFVFQPSTPTSDPREEWHKLMNEFGDDIDFAAPVVVDDQGQQSLPTGKIVLQFQDPPSGEALRQFENSYGLKYLATNEFKGEQLTFEARDNRETYQPELIERLKDDRNIKLAVPETMARYRRV
jgi:hypothetical protein